MKVNKDLIIKGILLLGILFVLYNQIKIINLIVSKEEMLDSEPLSYGARKYGIDECVCFVSPSKQIYFNKTDSKTILKHDYMEGFN